MAHAYGMRSRLHICSECGEVRKALSFAYLRGARAALAISAGAGDDGLAAAVEPHHQSSAADGTADGERTDEA